MTNRNEWRNALTQINEELKSHDIAADNMIELSVLLDAAAAATGRVFLGDDTIPADLEGVLIATRKKTESPLIDQILIDAVRSVSEEASRANYWAAADGMSSDLRNEICAKIGNLTRVIGQLLAEADQ